MGSYTSEVVRYLTFPEKSSIDDFDIDARDTYDAAFYTALFGIQEADATLLNEKSLCEIFNDAYYIVTLSLMQSHPERHLNSYCEIAKGENELIRKSIENESLRVAIVMGMVVTILEGFRHEGFDTGTERLALHIGTWSQKDDKRREIVERMKKAVDSQRYNQFRCPRPRDLAPLPLDSESINSITWENMLTLECDDNGPWEVAEHEAEWLVESIAGKEKERGKVLVDLIIEYFEKASRTERGINQSDNYKAYLRKFYSIKRDLYRKETPLNDPFGVCPNDTPSPVIEDLANNIDWVKLTRDFNLDRIKDIVETVGSSNREKKIIIKAIYDAESATGNMSRIPYSVDKLLNDLYKKYDENHKGLWDAAYNEETETLNLDMLMKQAIEEYMERHTATDADMDEIFNDNQRDMGQNTDAILSLKAQVKDLEKQLKAAKELDKKRIEEIDKWHGSYENAEAEISMWMSKYEEAIEASKCMERDERNSNPLKDVPQVVLTNNSNFARVIQAMVSARYFKRANGDETNATEVGGMLLKLFGVSNTWKSVLQKAYSRENPLRTFDELRDAGEKYWTNRTGLTKEIRKKGKK